MDFTILAVVLLIGVGVPVRNKLIRKYREEKKKQDRNTLLLLSLFTAINCCYLNSLSSS